MIPTSATEAEQVSAAGAEDPIEIVVTDRTAVADGVVAFTLEPVQLPAWPGYGPGAHIDVQLPSGVSRQYSLLGQDDPRGPARFAVLKTDDSRGGSRLIHEWLRPGHRLLVSPPKNNFELDESAGHSVLVAGGIGITPLLAMARRLSTSGASFELHYRMRSRARAAFLDELAELVPPGGLHILPDDAIGAGFSPEAVIAEAGLESALYVCGPEPFMDFVKRGAEVAGLPAEHVHEEHFKHEVATGGAPFVLKGARSGVEVVVGEDQTAADALATAGVFVATSCGQGVCGTCVTRVVEGVPDHRDVFLSPSQKRSGGLVTLCCSRAASDVLVVDL